MFGKVKVLQLGAANLQTEYELDPEVEWYYEPDLIEGDEDESYINFDVAFLGRDITRQEMHYLQRHVRAYGLFVFTDVPRSSNVRWLMKSRVGEDLDQKDLGDFLTYRLRDYFSKSYGEKYRMTHFRISPNFHGDIIYSGYEGVELYGDYGASYRQVGFWRQTLPLFKGQSIDFWLEYEKDYGVDLQLQITSFVRGSSDLIQEQWVFGEAELSDRHQCRIENSQEDAIFFVSLQAKGYGKLRVIGLHDRWGRHGNGIFIPGAKRLVTSQREEAFAYFEPGDLQPPLNVYFSGYKTREGFEGYGMLRSFGSPYLLISDQRLEGGGFYIGSDEYENLIQQEILEKMRYLGFTEKDLVLAGISMGSTGAIYYGSKLHPKYILAGKPLVNLGSIAAAERIQRPGGFPTSIDMLRKNVTGPAVEAVEEMNTKFWRHFDEAKWTDTAFIVSYMIEDDYDINGYQDLLKHLTTKGTRIYGKGIHGRHNDDTAGIVKWFLTEYRRIMERAYQRELTT